LSRRIHVGLSDVQACNAVKVDKGLLSLLSLPVLRGTLLQDAMRCFTLTVIFLYLSLLWCASAMLNVARPERKQDTKSRSSSRLAAAARTTGERWARS